MSRRMAFLHLPPIRWLTSFYNPPFNYDPHDKHAILKSDLMEDKTDEEIDQYMLNNLSIYDQIGE